jgi:hypothetical protein
VPDRAPGLSPISSARSSSATGADGSAVTVVVPVLLAGDRTPVKFNTGPNEAWCSRPETIP